MADTSCKDLLEAWGLGSLVDTFKEHYIDESTISHLTPELMKELIPQIGMRIKFIQKWENHFQKKSETLNAEDKENNSDSESTNISMVDNCDMADYSLERHSVVGTGTFKSRFPNIKVILRNTFRGRAVLKSYEKTKMLSRKCRELITDIIITVILKDTKRPLKNDDFLQLSQLIVQVFPSETTSTYYIPPVHKRLSKTKTSVTARGKLVDKYRNKIREYKRLTGCDIVESSSSCCSTASVTSDLKDNLETDIETESVLWLQHNQAPWELVLSHWEACARYPHNDIQNSIEGKVSDIINRWPILRHPMGYTLIEKDFFLLQLTTEANAITNWFTWFEEILKVCPIRKHKAAISLNDILKVEDINEDCKVASQLSLLSHLIPPKGRIRNKKEHWKPSISECKNSILMHAKIPGNICNIQESRIETMQLFGLTVQPYIIIVGSTLHEISEYYVCIDKILYTVPLILKAVDICFKAFHFLNAKYPPESEHLWLLIQRTLYNFTTKWDETISYISEIIAVMQTDFQRDST